MITIAATGFLPEKPILQTIVSQTSGATSHKVEFDVVATRREMAGNEWVTVYERATFFAWGDLAQRVAEQLDRGHTVMVNGKQKTSHWTDNSGQSRHRVKFELLAYQRVFTPQQGGAPGERTQHRTSEREREAQPQQRTGRPPQRFAKPVPQAAEEAGAGGAERYCASNDFFP